MPRINPRACEVGGQFWERPSRGRPKSSAHKAGSPSASSDASSGVHDLFNRLVALGLALLLWCSLTLAASLAESQVQDTAHRGFDAVSRVVGHMAHTDTPFADGRLLVNRQPG